MLWRVAVAELCAWNVDDVELVEFGKDVCQDVTLSLAWTLDGVRPANIPPIVCSGRKRNTTTSAFEGGPAMHSWRLSYVVIWELK